MCDQRANADSRVAEIAARQHGVISVAQLRTAGLDKHQVRHRRRTKRLHPIYRGIYAVGHPSLSQHGRWMAAVLACGEGAALSHRSAALLWGLLPNRGRRKEINVSIPDNSGRKQRAGIRLHRSSLLERRHVTHVQGISTTTASRTISDLRKVATPQEVRRAIRQAEVLGLPVALLEPIDGTRSELESEFLELCRRNQLPTPAVNLRVGSRIVDFVWSEQRLAVETDGYRYHRGRTAFEDDRARDLELRRLGYDVVRLSYRQVMDRPTEVAAVLQTLLGRADPGAQIRHPR